MKNFKEDIIKNGKAFLGRELTEKEVNEIDSIMNSKYELYLKAYDKNVDVDVLFDEDFYDNLKDVIEMLRKYGTDYNDIIKNYGINSEVVEEYESEHYEQGYGDVKKRVFKTNKEILEIFGEYTKVVIELSERIAKGETSGSMKWFFYKDDYDEITEEMEEIFDGEETTSILIEWCLNIE